MASTSSVTASPSTQRWTSTYDVFLNFRGQDVRRTFIDNLYSQLELKGIRTFKDDDKMKKGDCITPSLLNSIRESRFLIIVFSKSYASSKWCLEELATIMECQEKCKEQIVVPIFYDVEPSDVRNQKGSFEDSFKELEEKFKDDDKEKLKRWKEALKKAGYFKGHHLQNDYNGYEAKCVEGVAADILNRLNQASPAFEQILVGMDSRVDKIGKWLRLVNDDDDDDRFIGICGMGGIGKTTTATVVFNKFSHQFDGACFLADIRRGNIIELQKTLITTILKEKTLVELSNEQDGMNKIRIRLGRKKVLIVLDDVDDQLDQLEKLAGGGDWFGRGSKVIITTRDAGVLRSHGVNEKYIYEVHTLEEKEAIQLFNWYAFKKEPADDETGVKELSKLIVHYAMGLPLCLKVLGSHFCGLKAVSWEKTLEKLSDTNSLHTPKDKIFAVLRISFDGLDPDNQIVFLHIACFFRKWREEKVKDALDTDLLVLIDKSLISVQNGRVEIHDRILEMGLHIAGKEKPRTRVFKLKDVDNVLSGKMDPQHIQGVLIPSLDGIKEKNIEAFKRMENLKIFIIYERYWRYDGADSIFFHALVNCLPTSELMLFHFDNYGFTSLPESFKPSELVGFSLRRSSLENWRITQELSKLTYLDLSDSNSLLETPDFDRMPNLMRLNLHSCKKLKMVDSSIGNLRKLILLDLSGCYNLKNLPDFDHVSSLRSLALSNCEELENFPKIMEKTPHLVELDLRKVGIVELPSSIKQLCGLTKLCLDDCRHLACLCNELCELKNLKHLEIKFCKNLKSLPENLPYSLEYLNLQENCFDSLPENFSKVTSLQYLIIIFSKIPKTLPKLPVNIKELYADCPFNIAELAIQYSNLYSVSFSTCHQQGVITSLAKKFIHFSLHRKTPLCVSYPITADDIIETNKMLRTFKYRHYKSNRVFINLDSSWYSQNFVGFVVCFFKKRKIILKDKRLYEAICIPLDDITSTYHIPETKFKEKDITGTVIIAKLSQEDGKNEALQTDFMITVSPADRFDKLYELYKPNICGTVLFAYIPVRSLWGESRAIMDSSRLEVQFMNLEASLDWGCSLLYERQTGAREHTASHSGCGSSSASGLRHDDSACLTSLELETMEYLNLSGRDDIALLPEGYSNQLPYLRYLDISGCRRLQMLPKLPPTIRELYAHSNLAFESNIAELASKYSELYSVSFSHGYVTLCAKELAREFVQVPFQNRNSPFLVTYPTDCDDLMGDVDPNRWFKYSSSCPSNKVSINLNPFWYSQIFVGFVVCFLLKGRKHKWKSSPEIRPFRYSKVVAKLRHKDSANEVLQTNCVIARLYDEEFDGSMECKNDEFICFAYIPISSLLISKYGVNPNDYSAFEMEFQDSNTSSDWSCGLLYKNDESLSEEISNDNDSGQDKTKLSQLTEMVDPIQCRMVSMPECFNAKVVGLLYTKFGDGILTLSSNGIHKLWKWSHHETNPLRKATAKHWQISSGLLMINDVSGINFEEVVPCIGLSNDDSYFVVSAGEKVSLFEMNTFKVYTTFTCQSASTCLAFYPCDKNIIAIGTEDSSIHIYNVIKRKFWANLKGHQKRITGLTFSTNPYMLVSSGADAQLCVWNKIGRWKKIRSICIHFPSGEVPSRCDTQVMFHVDQRHLLVTHETQLAIYDASKMERKHLWIPQDSLHAPISSATYSCNSQLVYASFIDGNIGVLDAHSLRLRCHIAPSAYLSQVVSDRSQGVYAVVIASHPQKPNQFAVGLTNGHVEVIESRISQRQSGVSPPIDNEHSDDEEGSMDEDSDEDPSMPEYSHVKTTVTEDSDEEGSMDEDCDEDASMPEYSHVKTTVMEDSDEEGSMDEDSDEDASMPEYSHVKTTVTEDSDEEGSIMDEDSDEDASMPEYSHVKTTVTEDSDEGALMTNIIEEEIQSDHYHCGTITSQQKTGQDRTKSWELTTIECSTECRMVSMPECFNAKVVGLLYTNSGSGILTLSLDGIHKLWKWSGNKQYPTGKSLKTTANSVSHYWQTNSGLLEINDVPGINFEEVVPCIALSTYDYRVASAVGKNIALFNMKTFKIQETMRTKLAVPSTTTFLAFHPMKYNIIAIGTKDSTIYIYNVYETEVYNELTSEGEWLLHKRIVSVELNDHHKSSITGLTFSMKLKILVSSDADGQLCVWRINKWKKRSSFSIQFPTGEVPSGDTQVMFHADQVHLLITHKTQLAVYDASKIKLITQWIPGNYGFAPISYATYSCNSRLVYASFIDGNIGVFDTNTLRLRCCIAPSVYLSNRGQRVYSAMIIAAHPNKPNQFAVGLTDGSVKILEPLESQKGWGQSPPVDNEILNEYRDEDAPIIEDSSSDSMFDTYSDEEYPPQHSVYVEHILSDVYHIEEDCETTTLQQEQESVDPVQCRVVSMPECSDAKVVRLLYTNSGVGILALSLDGIQKLWKWSHSEQNPNGKDLKATANCIPQHWQPNSGLLMINDVPGDNLEKVVPCLDIFKDDSYVVSAVGGMVSLFNMNTFKVLTTFRPSTPTCLVVHPRDNIIAIGTKDSTIYIYDVRVDEVSAELINGHQTRITGLAFSTELNMLVSSGADARLCVWNVFDRWQKRRSVRIKLPAGEVHSDDTHVMFHANQLHLLVAHEAQIAIYDTSKMERICQWIPHGCLSAGISSATYSCNNQQVYASFIDGNIGVLDADNLRLRCRIAPSAYLSQHVLSSRRKDVYPLVIAAHPQESNQFAIGLTDGSVKVIEPLESQRKWGISPPVDIEILNEAEMAEHSTSVQTIEERGIIFRTCIASFIWLRQKLATMCTGSADSSDSGEEIKDEEMGSLDSEEEEEEEEETFDHQIEQRKKAYLDKGKAPAISSSP